MGSSLLKTDIRKANANLLAIIGASQRADGCEIEVTGFKNTSHKNKTRRKETLINSSIKISKANPYSSLQNTKKALKKRSFRGE
jgi:hypothetical protein